MSLIYILTWWVINNQDLHLGPLFRYLACDLLVHCQGDICAVKWTCPWSE